MRLKFLIVLMSIISFAFLVNNVSAQDVMEGTESEEIGNYEIEQPAEETESIEIDQRELNSFTYDERDEFEEAVKNELDMLATRNRNASPVTTQSSGKQQLILDRLNRIQDIDQEQWTNYRDEIVEDIENLKLEGAQPRD